MGNICETVPQTRQVNSMPNRVPSDSSQFRRYHASSSRFGDPLLTKKRDNLYNFIMTVRSEDELKQVSLEMCVLREMVDCILHPNYDLQILQNKTIIDIYDLNDFTQALVGAKHRKTQQLFSIKVYQFKSYTDDLFKQALFEISLHRMLESGAKGILNLLDYYVIDRSHGQKAVVLLYESVETSLSNVMQFRHLANDPWKHQQQAAIFQSLLNGCQSLAKHNIYHRDIRPSRLFYSRIKRQYLLGNLSDAIIVDPKKARDNTILMTPRGVPIFNNSAVNRIIEHKDVVGTYSVQEHEYYRIKRTMLAIANCDPSAIPSDSNITPALRQIFQKLDQGADIRQVARPLQTFDGRVNDLPQVEAVQFHLGQTNLKLNQSIILDTLYGMHFNQEFAKMAHNQIEYNIEQGKPQNNADLFMRLADYFSAVGSGSDDYYANALLLYLKASEKYRNLGYPQNSLQKLTKAKRAEANISNVSYKLMYATQLAQVRSALNDTAEAKQSIDNTLAVAAENLVNTQLQLQMLLAKARISLTDRNMKSVEQAQKYLKHGATICESQENFENPNKQWRFKADFLEALGESYYLQALYADSLDIKEEIKLAVGPGQRKKKHLTKAESHFVSALELRQRAASENSVPQIGALLYKMGMMYYQRRDFAQAKSSIARSLQLRKSYKASINPNIIADTYYWLANSNVHLSDYREAESNYRLALAIYEANPKEKHMAAVIKGNIGIVKMESGRQTEGLKEIQSAKQEIKQLKGVTHTDYVFLDQEAKRIVAKKQAVDKQRAAK